uniref:Uncharacterized protein n=1 Tax=Tetraodon nigroviridis TaxID=99883 RepID=H3CMZ1_TETNG
MVEDRGRVSPLKNFVAGGVAGACLLLAGHPLDTIKVSELKTQTKSSCAVLYTGTYDCFRKTVSKEGLRGLYKGMGAPLAGVAPMMAISFFGFGLGKQLQQTDSNSPLKSLPSSVIGLLAVTRPPAPCDPSACWSISVCVNVEAAQSSVPPVQEDFKSSSFSEVCVRVCEICSFLSAKQTPASKLADLFCLFSANILLAGGVAGILNWTIALPPDVLKSNFQTAAAEGKYRGLLDVLRTLLREEGPAALYKGFNAVFLRAFPANAACFLGFEMALKGLNTLAPSW